MAEERQTYWLDGLLVIIVAVAALGTRGWYLQECVDMGQAAAPLRVQDDARAGVELGKIADKLISEGQQFNSAAPLSKGEEKTAHVAPGYVWLLAGAQAWFEDPDMVMRWLQCVLGGLTAVCYFLFARQAFGSLTVAALAGLLAALHPFWIINTAEISDGVLATFLLSASLFLGTRSNKVGGPLAGLFFGLALAGLCLVRAVMLPFALLSMMWFLLHSRHVRRGWFCALLAFLGFANGLAPWMVRNFQAFQRPVPITDSAYYHLWVGNNPLATGGPLDENTLRSTLSESRLKELLDETNQSRRYDMLSQEVLDEATQDSASTLARRLWAGLYFVFGKAWFDLHAFAIESDPQRLPDWLAQSYSGILSGAMLAMLLLGLLGWRWSQALSKHTQLAVLAAIWLPLPYMLSHAETLSGPRLPLDGVLLTFTAFAIASLIPGWSSRLSARRS